MDKDVLQGFLVDGRSLEEIGRRLGKHPSTVRYWVGKHGLDEFVSTRYLATGGVAREELERLVADGLTVREISAKLAVSYTTVRYWLRKYGLQTTRAQTIASTKAGLAAGLEVVERTCQEHGVTNFVLEARGYYRCMRCRAKRVSESRRRVKERLVAEAGGCCQRCGYDGCIRALHFHHDDPSSKLFAVASAGSALSLSTLRAEARKCTLLCANCHAAVEAGVAELG